MGAHGVLILSPKAAERVDSYNPAWPVPKVLSLKAKGKLNRSIFEGSTINTPSMLVIEDYLDALRWIEKDVGGLGASITKSQQNLSVIESFVARTPWIKFLAEDPAYRSNTSVCLKIADMDETEVKALVKLLETERVAFDIGAYRDAPAGLRIWAGTTVSSEDLIALCDWIDYAHAKVKASKK
eukprot:Amastigsp_a843233_28.p2 type:complete len:183 gc:universal Amastigsp_a843233_28:566-18(-)